MRAMITTCLTACLVAASASAAHADAYVGLFTGVNFGGDAGQSLDDALDDGNRLTWGGVIGGMAGGVFGGELDVAYVRHFYGEGSPLGNNSVLTVMPTLIVGIPLGGQQGPGLRPYVTAGVGVIRRELQIGTEQVFDDNDLAYSVGFGVTGFLSDHFGVRGDYRYFRNVEVDDSTSAFGLTIDRGTFNFSRGTIGLIVRF